MTEMNITYDGGLIMLKLAVLADLHLPEETNAVQYDAFAFALNSIRRRNIDCIVCLGDITACGNLGAARFFLEQMNTVNAQKLIVTGNSDIRTPETAETVKMLETNKTVMLGDYRLSGICTADGNINAADRRLLMQADSHTLIFMHHPGWELNEESAAFMKKWVRTGTYRMLGYGHMHFYSHDGNVYGFQALDPDKAIGSPPGVTYVNLEERDIRVEFDSFPCGLPADLKEYMGLSCFDVSEDIPFAAEYGIRNIELRPDAAEAEPEKLSRLILDWRRRGGKYLSLHMPDFGLDDKNRSIGDEKWKKSIAAANALSVDGVTIHVPKVPVYKMKGQERLLVLKDAVSKIRQLPKSCAVGIENMHMTGAEQPDETRRYGYIPWECLEICEDINRIFGFERAGLLLDVGHARNNPPFSQRYGLGSWYEVIGRKTEAYHIHQVSMLSEGMENHTAINSLYGPLISYCGFFHCWNQGRINHKPLFLEIRGGRKNYLPSLKTFISLEG